MSIKRVVLLGIFLSSSLQRPKHDNPVGSYLKEFILPEGWKSKRTFLIFEGVKSAGYFWVNGHFLGYNQDSRTPAEFEITKYLQGGVNVICAEVYRWCDGSYLECQDMWRMSGIFREVYLINTPNILIQDFKIDANLDDNYENGLLNVE